MESLSKSENFSPKRFLCCSSVLVRSHVALSAPLPPTQPSSSLSQWIRVSTPGGALSRLLGPCETAQTRKLTWPALLLLVRLPSAKEYKAWGAVLAVVEAMERSDEDVMVFFYHLENRAFFIFLFYFWWPLVYYVAQNNLNSFRASFSLSYYSKSFQMNIIPISRATVITDQ